MKWPALPCLAHGIQRTKTNVDEQGVGRTYRPGQGEIQGTTLQPITGLLNRIQP